MLAETDSVAVAAERWLADFERALATGGAALEGLFERDSHWRDVLALTWRIGTVSGAGAIASGLKERAARARPRAFRLDPDRTAPRQVTRAGEKCVEAIYRFETADGPGAGVVRFRSDKAWTLLTALEDLNGGKKTPKNGGPEVLI